MNNQWKADVTLNNKDRQQKKTKIYIKGSGTSGCLLTGKMHDQPEFIQVKIDGREIVEVKLAGLFAIGLTKPIKQKYEHLKEQEDVDARLELIKWGNFNGTLILYPQIVNLPMNIKIMRISCGWNHVLLKSSQGMLFGLGQNKYGQLGLQLARSFIDEPKLVVSNKKYQEGIQTFAAGFRQSYWIDKNHKIFGCGESKNYQLGVSTKKQLIDCIQIQIDDNENNQSNIEIKYSKFIKIACGKKYMIALNNNKEVYGIGTNQYQCLNDDENIKYYTKLTKIQQNIHDVASGWTHILMIDQQDRVMSRGRNNLGQLGRREDQGSQDHLVKITEKCQQIAVGTQFSFAVGNSGKLYGWGWNEHMNIISHQNNQTIIYNPSIVPIPHNFTITQCITFPAITILMGNQF